MEITPETKIHALLETYPELEAFLMSLNPKYKKLKNPVLRRTVARIATLSQVAKIGGYAPLELVNLLRKELGQPPLETEQEPAEAPEPASRPHWAKEPAVTLDGTALLDEQKNPLAEVRKAMKKLTPGQALRLDTDFYPAPLIESFEADGFPVWSEQEGEKLYHTWLLKR